MAKIQYPPYLVKRNLRYWLQPKNILASRQKIFRVDYSNEWRYEFGTPFPADRSVPLHNMLDSRRNSGDGFRFVILADTGEGDYSQYSLLPLLRAVKPDFMIINGDVAYPAGRMGDKAEDNDFLRGFFKPYKNFNCPVWAAPGNHEYYSPNNGKEFYDIFCTRNFDSLWSEYGLRHVLQPGTYWELSDIEHPSKLVVIGIDSGKSANLDGHNSWWQVWKKRIQPDTVQHTWLDQRLRRAQSQGGNVIILYHIPALSRDKKVEEHLNTLHKIIAGYSCVKLVTCGHDHNFQFYSPETFRKYIQDEEQGSPQNGSSFPAYMVNGGGGAYLQSTGYPIGKYKGVRYPSIGQWKEYAKPGRRFIAFGRDKSGISRLAGAIAQDVMVDADAERFLSFLLVEFRNKWPDDSKNRIRITPVFLDDLNELFKHLDEDKIVDVTDENPPVNPEALHKCFQKDFEIVL